MKNAVVLGASGKLGNAITEKLVEEGFKVIGTKRPSSNREITKKENVYFIDLEIKDNVSIDKFIKQIKEKGVRIDFFTSTIADIPKINRFEKMPQHIFEEDIGIVLNHIYLLRQLIPCFNENANILFILTEMLFNKRHNYTSSYLISKYALLGLMKALVNEMPPNKIRVNAVSPGMMDTSFTAKIPRFIKERYQKEYGLTEPAEVAAEIVRIIKNSEINGENIPVFKKGSSKNEDWN